MEYDDLIAVIEHVAPLKCAASWDNSGLQIASPRLEISHVALCLDPSLVQVEKALELGADFILSHHPLSMKAKYLNKMDEYFAIAKLLLSHDVALYSAHTSLDANACGPVSWLADSFELQNRKVLEPSVDDAYGIGIIGDLPNVMNYNDFSALLFEKAPMLNNITVCGKEIKELKRVAICPGSGSSLIDVASSLGADIMITGDIKYHSALDSKIALIDVGHFSLEEEMMRRFSLFLNKYIKTSFLPANDPFRILSRLSSEEI